MKRIVTVVFLISLVLPAISFAQEPKFYPGFVKVEELSSPATAHVSVGAATEQVVTNVPVWITSCSYALLNATSVIKIKDAAAPTDAVNWKSIMGQNPVFNISNQNTSDVIQFTYPIYCARGIILDVTDAIVHIQYLPESNRRKNLR